MIYKVNFRGYRIVEADSEKEALQKAEDEDYIEESFYFTTVKKEEGYSE